jgi:hypothetical protein
VEEVKVRYLLYDDVYDIRYHKDKMGYRLNQDFLISQIDEYYGIDRIVEEKNGFCVVDIEDEFDTIMVYIDNAGDIEFAHEAVKNFFEYLVNTTL